MDDLGPSSPILQDLNAGILRFLACDPEGLEAGVQELWVLGGCSQGEGAAVAISVAEHLHATTTG